MIEAGKTLMALLRLCPCVDCQVEWRHYDHPAGQRQNTREFPRLQRASDELVKWVKTLKSKVGFWQALGSCLYTPFPFHCLIEV
jgi:hypothetical protein